jgi:hypothetical protein
MSNKNYTTKNEGKLRGYGRMHNPTSTPVVASMVPLQNDKNII